MHNKPVKESDGQLSLPVATTRPCPSCRSTDTWRQDWASHDGGHEDEKYTCNGCGHIWWVEGIDS